MRLYVSPSYWVPVLGAIVFVAFGADLLVTGSTLADRVGGLFVVVMGLGVAFGDMWRFLLVASPDAVHESIASPPAFTGTYVLTDANTRCRARVRH